MRGFCFEAKEMAIDMGYLHLSPSPSFLFDRKLAELVESLALGLSLDKFEGSHFPFEARLVAGLVTKRAHFVKHARTLHTL